MSGPPLEHPAPAGTSADPKHEDVDRLLASAGYKPMPYLAFTARPRSLAAPTPAPLQPIRDAPTGPAADTIAPPPPQLPPQSPPPLRPARRLPGIATAMRSRGPLSHPGGAAKAETATPMGGTEATPDLRDMFRRL